MKVPSLFCGGKLGFKPMISELIEPLAIGGGAATLTLGGLAYATFVPRCGVWGRLVTRGSRDAPPRVALTFDDGPLPGVTDRVLDTLGELEVKAAFFVIGRSAAAHPKLIRRMHEEGHVIGNHSFDHAGMAFLRGSRYWREQLDRTDAAIREAVGVTPRLFRPPLGIKTWHIVRAAARRHIMIAWTRRAFDGVSTTPQQILQRILPGARAGDILVLHDGLSRQSRRDPTATVDALRPLIAGLRVRGLEPMRLDELTRLHPYTQADSLADIVTP